MVRHSRGGLGCVVLTVLVTATQLAACSPPAEQESPVPGTELDVPRTGNLAARGYTEADFPRVQEIAPGVYTYEGLHAGAEKITTVSMFVVTDEGVLVADGQGSVEETADLVARIAEITDQPITHVVMCSDHGDHTAGNAAFPPTAEFIAHPTSAALLDEPPTPTMIVADQASIELGSRTVEIHFLGRAHTGGDLHVYLPDEKILFMSEAYLNRIFPAMRSAYPTEWLAVLDRALGMDVDMYVPGHGFIEEPAILNEEIATYREATTRVIAQVRDLHEAGMSVDEAVEAADFGELGSWSLSSSQGPIAVRRVYMELNGELPEH